MNDAAVAIFYASPMQSARSHPARRSRFGPRMLQSCRSASPSVSGKYLCKTIIAEEMATPHLKACELLCVERIVRSLEGVCHEMEISLG
jgi:hypothetical protein